MNSEVLKGIFEGYTSAQRNTPKGTSTAYTITISGKKIGAGFSNKLFKDLPSGTPVEYTIKQNGNFINLESLQAVPGTPTGTVPAQKGEFVSSGPTPTGSSVQVQIVRQNALSHASALVIAQAFNLDKKPTLKKMVENTVAFADHFVRYIETGKVEVLNEEVAKKLEEAVKGE